MAKSEPEQVGRTSEDLAPDVRAALDACEQADGYLLALFSYKDGELRLWRKSSAFPIEDMDSAVDLLDDDLRVERLKSRGDES